MLGVCPAVVALCDPATLQMCTCCMSAPLCQKTAAVTALAKYSLFSFIFKFILTLTKSVPILKHLNDSRKAGKVRQTAVHCNVSSRQDILLVSDKLLLTLSLE